MNAARQLDRRIIEFKDVFRLRPKMPMLSNADPTVLERLFREANAPYNNLERELEDLLGTELLSAFCEEYPNAVSRESQASDILHRDFTRDGKARLHRFAREQAMGRDLTIVTGVLKAFRRYFGLREEGISNPGSNYRTL